MRRSPTTRWLTGAALGAALPACVLLPRRAVQFSRDSVDYKRVLDIGVGHVHHHEQYEGVTGGEVQPFFIDWSNPNWLYNAAAHYRFMFGPVRDGDGYIDGTCNFYVLAQLKDNVQIQAAEVDTLARRSAYGALWLDEQSYFTQRWHLVAQQLWS